MRAPQLNGPGEKFQLTDVPDPVAGPGEAVVKVLTCGAGLTIQHVKAGRTPVVSPNYWARDHWRSSGNRRGRHSLVVGDAVTAYFYLTCGSCKWCLRNRETLCENFGGYVGRAVDGGYAEYIKLPASTFLKIPDSLDYKKHAAQVGVISDAIATLVKVIRRARITSSDTVAVFGAGGGLGIHMLMLAKWAHTRVIAVETKPENSPRAGTQEPMR